MSKVTNIFSNLKGNKLNFSLYTIFEFTSYLSENLIFVSMSIGLVKYLQPVLNLEWWQIFLFTGLSAVIKIVSVYLSLNYSKKLVNGLPEDLKNKGYSVFYSKRLPLFFVMIAAFIFSFVYLGLVSSFIISAILAIAYFAIGYLIPLITKKRLNIKKEEYLKEKKAFDEFYLAFIKSGNTNDKDLNKENEKLSHVKRNYKREQSRTHAIVDFAIGFFVALALIIGIVIYYAGLIDLYGLILAVVAFYSSFTPVVRFAFTKINDISIKDLIE